MPKRVTSGWVHLRNLAPGQHSSEEMSQWRQTVGNTTSNWTSPVIKPQTSRTDNNVLPYELNEMFSNDLTRPSVLSKTINNLLACQVISYPGTIHKKASIRVLRTATNEGLNLTKHGRVRNHDSAKLTSPTQSRKS